jgi:membrane peptidoglycan carboxypeptidase
MRRSSIEDQNFYSEPAYDWKGIARAVWIDITHPGGNRSRADQRSRSSLHELHS